MSEVMPTIKESIMKAAAKLTDSGIDEPVREASTLVAFALGVDKAYLIVNSAKILADAEQEKIISIVHQRAERIPFQYITGRQEFYGLDFIVTPDVLIPRPETEFAVEECIGLFTKRSYTRFCEIGIGSGCISVSILKNLPTASAVGLDISDAALTVAQQNADKHKVTERLRLLRSNIYSALNRDLDKFDLIVSNPPYIPAGHIAGLQPEVRDHEPHTALTDGEDGTTLIKKIVEGAHIFLRPGGALVMEIGYAQAEEVISLFPKRSWSEVRTIADLQGIPRVVSAISVR